MGILKGALTFSRYAVSTDLPERFLEFAHQRLVQGAFSGLQTTQRQKTMGWVGLEDILDTGFTQGRHVKGDYLLFSLRVDRKAVPASLLKVEAMTAERQYLQETGKDRLYREQKQDIRDRIQLSLLEQSLAVPTFYDICWSLSGKWLIFTSLAENACMDFQEMFKESFGFIPSPWVPWGNIDTAAKEEDPALTPIKEETIGREFLTWLWFKSEERGGVIALPQRGDIEVIFLRKQLPVTGPIPI
jgi:recombination associated protein RdgC